MKLRIKEFKTIDSTNSYLREQAKQGAEEGLVAVSQFQKDGRGKQERQWHSARGKDLLFSLLAKPNTTPQKAPLMTQLACRSVARVLNNRYNLKTVFKRPNDILVDGKKICGILIETQTSHRSRIDSMVIGIGLNVNSNRNELIESATSIKLVLGKSIARKPLLDSILEELTQDLAEIDNS